MVEEPKYFKCETCGGTIRKVPRPSATDIDTLTLCIQPSKYKPLGICSGSVTIEITKDEYETSLRNFEINKK